MAESKSSPVFSFEEAYARLEQILERINGGAVSLEESLKLYEEADKLIVSCSAKLMQAEQKIEMLIKGRSGELLLDEQEKPLLQPFPIR